jgi:DNA-binding CsgD family transcriptional regulator
MLSGDVELARAAVDQIRNAAEPVPVALTLAELARIADAAGERAVARTAMDEAVRIIESIGAEPSLLEPLPRDAAPAPRKRANRATFGWESLTPTERRVVDAVAEGLSNPQIAQRLVVSRHTVESHMKHVFTKLGISSRVELAAAAIRREVSPPTP